MQVEDIALSNCDREPVHIPGRIQSFGTLLAYEVRGELIRYAGANFSDVLGGEAEPPLGSFLPDVLEHGELVHAIRGALGLPSALVQRERLGEFKVGSTLLDVSVHRTENLAVLELEPVRECSDRPDAEISRVRSMLANVEAVDHSSNGEHESYVECLQAATESLRHLTGFDRVMGYRFLANGDGEVAAEACSPGIEPFLGLRYPAWDIPTQVREIALRMPIRIIADVADQHVELLTEPGMSPLDLVRCHVRGVSPVHLEYLRNMGVAASMNCSIIVRGELWGLFAFHHYRPKVLSPSHRSICDLFAQLFSVNLQRRLDEQDSRRSKRAESALRALRTAGDLRVAGQILDELPRVIPADGVALLTAGPPQTHGTVPAANVLTRIAELANGDIVPLESLAAAGLSPSALGPSAGALVIRLDDAAQLVFCRNEITSEVRWAGSREKTITHGPLGPRLHPRSSFSEYRELVHGRSAEWTRADLAAAGEVRSLFGDILERQSNQTEADWQRERRQQGLLIAELNHRVKNVLALVRSIARQTKDSAASLDEFAAAFEQRITSLAKAHDLVGGSKLLPAPIVELLRTELRPYLNQQRAIELVGPPFAFRPAVAPVMALVFHELATNAAKYGALGRSGGKLDVAWCPDAGGLAIEWRETLSDELPTPSRRGFGLALVERAIPFECGGEAAVEFSPTGLRVRLWLPHEAVTPLEQSPSTDEVQEPAIPVELHPFGRSLVVEDNMVLAMEMESLLTELGSERIDAAATAEIAERLLAEHTYAVALLDINLGAATSYELAKLAGVRSVPMLFVSGYGANVELPAGLSHVATIGKPVDRDALAAKLAELKVGI